MLNLLSDRLSLFQADRSEPISLFRQHFILFHALYRLQQILLARQEAQLQISPLLIILHSYRHHDDRQQLDQADPLRAYYLDLNHLYETGEAEVNAWLGSFWEAFHRHDRRKEALQVLGLTDPVDNASIRQRYRQLVMHHHPDRGGDTHRLQLLNAAIATLLPAKT